MIYLGSPRFVVRELEGYPSVAKRPKRPGLSVTVVDRAYCGQVIRLWRSEEMHTGGPLGVTGDDARAQLRAEAEALAESLNAGGRCTGGSASPAVTLLSPVNDLPSLSPFDSGCPQ